MVVLRRVLASLGLAAFLLAPAADAHQKDVLKAQSYLVRHDSFVTDADAVGRVRIVKHLGKGAQDGFDLFQVDLWRVDTTLTHGLWMRAVPDVPGMVLLGPFEVVKPGPEGHLRFRASIPGDGLPFGVDGVQALGGRQMRVISPFGPVVGGTVPQFSTSKGKLLAATILAPSNALDIGGHGLSLLCTWPGADRHRFSVHMMSIHADVEHELYLETEPGSGEMGYVASLEEIPLFGGDGEDEGSGPPFFPAILRYVVDTAEGQALPFGVPDNEALLGRIVAVEVLDQIVAIGRLPEAFLKLGDHKDSASFSVADGSPSPNARGKLRVVGKGKLGTHRFTLRAKKLDVTAAGYYLFVESGVATGSFLDAGALELKKSGRAGVFSRHTKRGDPLPLGVEQLEDLVGRRVQVRAGIDTAVLEVVVPGA